MAEVHPGVTTVSITDCSKPVDLAALPELKMATEQGRGEDCPHQRPMDGRCHHITVKRSGKSG